MSHKVIIAGSSGLIGSALVGSLRSAGHTVIRLVRDGGRTDDPDVSFWDPSQRFADRQAFEGCSVVINLNGAGLADARWSAGRMRLLESSRLEPTRFLGEIIASTSVKPSLFVSASAVGYYGNRPWTEIVDEDSEPGSGFLADLCVKWEKVALSADNGATRTVVVRTGMVLSSEGGALAKMMPFFKRGFGGPVGSGKQAVSWIAIDDAIGAIRHIIENTGIHGPVNLMAPNPVTNGEFASTLAGILGRTARLSAPAAAARLMFGRMADEVLLGGQRVLPKRLLESGYGFRYPILSDALTHILSGPAE